MSFKLILLLLFWHLFLLCQLFEHASALPPLPSSQLVHLTPMTFEAMCFRVLSLNNIRFFNHNHTNTGWPTQLTHL